VAVKGISLPNRKPVRRRSVPVLRGIVSCCALVGAVLGVTGCERKEQEEQETALPSATGFALFGIPARRQEGGAGLPELDGVLPPGVRGLKLGASRAEVRNQRVAHYGGESMSGPLGSLIELHGSGSGSYAERLRRGSPVPLDRLEVFFGTGGEGVRAIRMNTEYGRMSRDVVLELGGALGKILGEPDHVFDLRQGEVAGMQWISGEGRIRLWFHDPPGSPVVGQLSIENPQEMMTDTALNRDVVLEKRGVQEDAATFLKAFLERALPENGD
jgi:hypothetical protein